MKISECYNAYWTGVTQISTFRQNDSKTNAVAILKIFSYFTILIPLGILAIHEIAQRAYSLKARIHKKENVIPQDQQVKNQAKKQFSQTSVTHSAEDPTPEPNKDTQTQNSTPSHTTQVKTDPRTQIIDILRDLHVYTDDLTPIQKTNLATNFTNDNILQIRFSQAPTLNVTIRREDLFNSQAQVIVNAANSHLGGGGGIDGAIHTRGGSQYKTAHQELQTTYKSNYPSGHASMIESGLLKQTYNIDHVIVVAGPQGSSTPQKESALYSCYYNSLVLAGNQNKTSIAFPSISTGVFAFPRERAAAISLKAIYDFIIQNPNTTLKAISIHFLAKEPKAYLDTYELATIVV